MTCTLVLDRDEVYRSKSPELRRSVDAIVHSWPGVSTAAHCLAVLRLEPQKRLLSRMSEVRACHERGMHHCMTGCEH